MRPAYGDQERACAAKKRYWSPKSAKSDKAAILASGAILGGIALRVYACQYCRGWHLGNDWRVVSRQHAAEEARA